MSEDILLYTSAVQSTIMSEVDKRKLLFDLTNNLNFY